MFPNGDKCGRDHLINTCFYQDPMRCRDPRMRKLIESKIEKKSTSSAGAHKSSHLNDDNYEDEDDEFGHTATVCGAHISHYH